MQVTVTISDDLIRDAGFRNLNIVEYVESLIDIGLQEQARPALFSAIDRIRELHDGGRSEHHAGLEHSAEESEHHTRHTNGL